MFMSGAEALDILFECRALRCVFDLGGELDGLHKIKAEYSHDGLGIHHVSARFEERRGAKGVIHTE